LHTKFNGFKYSKNGLYGSHNNPDTRASSRPRQIAALPASRHDVLMQAIYA